LRRFYTQNDDMISDELSARLESSRAEAKLELGKETAIVCDASLRMIRKNDDHFTKTCSGQT
jgi:hypothetical protein